MYGQGKGEGLEGKLHWIAPLRKKIRNKNVPMPTTTTTS